MAGCCCRKCCGGCSVDDLRPAFGVHPRERGLHLGEPLRIVGEIERWEPHPPERLAEMKGALARMDAEGGPEIID